MAGLIDSAIGRAMAVAVAALPLMLAGCATPPTDPAAKAAFDQTNDPLEPMNRTIFDFNDGLYTNVIFPIGRGYNWLFPTPARTGIHNVIGNLNEPIVFMNKTLQAKPDAAGTTVARFLINTIFGFGGLIDVASNNHINEPKAGDFGATLYSWGIGEGPYLVLPFFGPSNPRDAVGMGADGAADPWGYVWLYTTYPEQIGTSFGKGIDLLSRQMEDYEQARKTSLDFYAFLRSSYRQNRRFELGEKASADDSLYDVPPDKDDHP
ncbi:MAG TPA: VacJ family lipoprotein [Alphaproteobacteria bacterium]|jgi:phospholipid-binding lipoprotein MlaA|nr:VacJ family lipoprotein [Alphaproteobacteria bacterium]